MSDLYLCFLLKFYIKGHNYDDDYTNTEDLNLYGNIWRKYHILDENGRLDIRGVFRQSCHIILHFKPGL